MDRRIRQNLSCVFSTGTGISLLFYLFCFLWSCSSCVLLLFTNSAALLFSAVLWIRIVVIADPGPAFLSMLIRTRIQIQGFDDDQKSYKIYSWKKVTFFWSKIAINFSLGLHKERSSYRSSLFPSERTSSTSKREFSSLLKPTKINVDPCGSGSTTLPFGMFAQYLPTFWYNIFVLRGCVLCYKYQVGDLHLWRLRMGSLGENFRYFCCSVWEFYHYRRELMASKLPNPAHLSIAACEHRWRQENRSAAVLCIPSGHCYVKTVGFLKVPSHQIWFARFSNLPPREFKF